MSSGMSDHEGDDMMHASFLRPSGCGSGPEPSEPTATSATTPATTTTAAPTAAQPSQPEGEQECDDEDDDDEPPRDVPRVVSGHPFAPRPVPFASTASWAQQRQPPQAQAPPLMMDEHLRVSEKCTARKCLRVQWEAEMNPRCREKTTLNVEGKLYLFDGFYLLCHDEPPDVPQFEYTRGGVMCRMHFVKEDLPRTLLPPAAAAAADGANAGACAGAQGPTTSPAACNALFLVQRYLFQQLLGIQMPHLFQTVFADPARATGDPSDICSDMHLVPRFIAVNDAPLLNKADLVAPHRIGFAVGKLLPIEIVLGCLEASSKYTAQYFLDHFPASSLIDCIVSARVNGVPGAFRVDHLVHASGDAADVKPARVVRLTHAGEGAREYDGARGRKRLKKWLELGPLVQISPRVDPHVEQLAPDECHLTGLRTDVFEMGSAMPMVLKYIRHYKLLATFERDMGLAFADKTLLRQAFTHGSYVDAGMQSVNTVEATIARVRLAHVFEHAGAVGGVDRKRRHNEMMGLDTDSSGAPPAATDPEVRRVTETHLTSDYRPEFHSKYLCPYERLEFLGDAVLSFLVATSAFLKVPSAREGQLHEIRKDVANNQTLGTIARAANFEQLMLTAYDLAKVPEAVTTKIAADCLEALLGAVFKDQGIEACRELFLELLARHDPSLRDLYLLTMPELVEKAARYVDRDREAYQAWPRAVETRLLHRRFTEATRVHIRSTPLWLECVTHPSFKAPQIAADEFIGSEPNYERIEFLGDAVLQLLSSVFLVDTFPHHQEDLLTQARSSLVKNTRLAGVARKTGYEPFLRLGNDVKARGQLYTEDVLADVFEASLGAVFLENVRDLGKIRGILEATLFPRIKEAIERREWMNPRMVLLHHRGLWSSTGKDMTCAFEKIDPPGPTPDVTQQHCVALRVNGYVVARACGRTVHAAKDAACRRALMLYGVRMHPDS
ncbi:hypothetical protein ATCC90586_002475 [Pythium insidiosum]|nr:hypothetical protein ATCC90586_002475 [Pythium insidiosum]